jgi:hypothetical protein
VVCRNREPYEQDILRKLLSNGFEEVICNPISEKVVIHIFNYLGIVDYSREVIEFGRNFLNLELIGQIRIQEPGFNFSTLTDEVHLWQKYIEVWRIREGRHNGDEMLRIAINLARQGLNHPDSIFETDFPQSNPLKRLISWSIITSVEGRIYRFRHEKFQDFIYSLDASERLLMPNDILGEILEHKSRNIFRWVELIYAYKKSDKRIRFLEEVFNV